jgi:valyl-tRNA synthetase
MSELSKTYDAAAVEQKWYEHWLKSGYFHSVPDERPSYTIVIPPPNVTGVLHMGHMLNNTIQDILVRHARQKGYNACWVPGTDHASIATEAKVVRMLREMGIKKSDLSREKFLEYAWEWKEKYGGIILQQLRQLGASCDWERTTFTMDEGYYKAVIRVFVDLHKKGYIYRGLRMINWDCEAQTALSNEEVIYNEAGETSQLYHVRYAVEGIADEWITIATTRPETILADTAIAVNPADERYQHLKGKYALVPFINRRIPIIFDDYVDKDFGTGCLKVTPAHDQNDYDIGLRHQLPVIDIINKDGTINYLCEWPDYVGMDRMALRKRIVKDLDTAGFLVKTEQITNKVGRSERTNSVVEPKLSYQWFLDMQQISKKALEVVENDEVELLPAKFKNTYRHWMENVQDWCISRQLWWGHRIPAWYLPDGSYVVAEHLEEALAEARKINPTIQKEDLRQDEDVLDTWASSWLWPIQVFGGFDEHSFDRQSGKILMDKNPELRYYYPTQVLVTAPEILFFWVARMIIAGLEYTGEIPFKTVYLTGIVRDKQGRKMSKSLGNSPEPLELIAKNGADGVRFGMLFASPAGNDLLYDDKLVEQGRNFTNKIWNALRLVNGWTVEDGTDKNLSGVFQWMDAALAKVAAELEKLIAEFRLSDAQKLLYNFIWDDFCSWYLEWIKPAFGQAVKSETYHQTVHYFEQMMVLLHPFMPFITEEVWHALKKRSVGEDVMVQPYPSNLPFKQQAYELGEQVKQLITAIRNARAKANVSSKVQAMLYVESKDLSAYKAFSYIITERANISSIIFQAPDNSASCITALIGTDKIYIDLGLKINVEEERKKLLEEIKYFQGFVASVEKKLANEKFVQNAHPDVVARERKKMEDSLSKIAGLQASLDALS